MLAHKRFVIYGSCRVKERTEEVEAIHVEQRFHNTQVRGDHDDAGHDCKQQMECAQRSAFSGSRCRDCP